MKPRPIWLYLAKFNQIKTHLLESRSNNGRSTLNLMKFRSNPVKYMRIQTNPDQTESNLVQPCQIQSNPIKPKSRIWIWCIPTLNIIYVIIPLILYLLYNAISHKVEGRLHYLNRPKFYVLNEKY